MPTPTATQILCALNNCEVVDLEALDFCVITGGYMHDIHLNPLPAGSEPNYWPFERGEVLVLNEWGREPFGEGRKPSKWSVTTFETKDFDAATALSGLIKLDPKLPSGLYEWSDGLWIRPDDQEATEQRRRDRSALIAQIGDQD